ncbi:MAG: flavodoxin-dependent (E)-4-hydroxy-3-methylbut-2-enyl-diphosphate synthase [Oscillospiraceae bacterium]|nr:flavodoxin-dependent (E)-4-hydroxy-3-methylbut-2-enyl-diphosphate synthase [Oscillospiraceae bacterium]
MRNVKKIKLKDITFGDGKIYIQSMLNIPSEDIEGNIKQAIELEKAGCEILRVAIPDDESIALIKKIKENISIPLVADIHFDYRLALKSIENGIDKIRINPGNIGSEDKIKQVVDACKSKNIPIRIGVNSGSLEKHILEKYKKPTAEALVESALYHVNLLEKFNFHDIIISIKSSNVSRMIKSYELIAEKVSYPLHLGVTEAGTERMGLIKSSIGIGSLLANGIGETIRVSLTADPVKEILAANDILLALHLKNDRIKFISCPTCGRTKIDLISLANKVEKQLGHIKKNITVAIMGCVVNGPGEAKEADIGIAGGVGCAVLFKKGKVIKKIQEKDIADELISEIEKM